MDVVIRDFSPHDYPDVVAVRNAAAPKEAVSIEGLLDRDRHRPAAIKWRRWVAETSGRVVGVGEYTQSTDLYHPRKFQIIICVHPHHQSQGIGSMLYEHLARQLQPFGPLAFQARAHEDESRSLRFLTERGFKEDFRQWESHLEASGFDADRWSAVEERVRALGISIVTLADLGAAVNRDRRLYDLEVETDADVPSPDSVRNGQWPRDENRFQRYAERILNNPDRPPWTYLVAVKDGEYIGLSYGEADLERGLFDIDMTGVRRAYRGLGVATALKVQAIVQARAHGMATIRTWNDTANQPILALNDKLGFVRQPALIFLEKPLPQADPRVDAYINALPEWQQRVCQTVRKIAHDADPEVQETIKRSVQPYFVLQGNICALLATRDHVNVFLYDPLVPDPEGIITSGHENKTGRTISVYEGEAINESALLAMFRAIIAHNRAGGWRTLTR